MAIAYRYYHNSIYNSTPAT